MTTDKAFEILIKTIETEVTSKVLEQVNRDLDKMVEKRIELASEYLSVNKACEYLDVSRTTFYKLLDTHKPTAYKLHNSPRYFIRDLDKMHTLVY